MINVCNLLRQEQIRKFLDKGLFLIILIIVITMVAIILALDVKIVNKELGV